MVIGPTLEHSSRPKKLICALDGTWADSDAGRIGRHGDLPNRSNVARISSAIKPEDGEHHAQLVHYQAGPRTGLSWWNHIVGGETDLGLSEDIREAYMFLANNYTPGDAIFLVGFSRGSYIARSLGGLIGQLGLLNKKGLAYFDEIFYDWQHAGHPYFKRSMFWRRYREDSSATSSELKYWEPYQHHLRIPTDNPDRARDYLREYRTLLRSLGLIYTDPIREDFEHDISIRAIAVWDTVGALGIPVSPWFQPDFLHKYKWLDTTLPDNVSNAFQALALDEHRALFSPAVWQRPKGCQTNLKQVWFPGTHADIGGSRDNNTMADITLAWMMDQLSGEGTRLDDKSVPDRKDWIEFDDDYLDSLPALNEITKGYPPRGQWVLGALYDTFAFPLSLAGRNVRTPGCHRMIGSVNKRAQTSGVLTRDTQEYIHASAGVRLADEETFVTKEDGAAMIIFAVVALIFSLATFVAALLGMFLLINSKIPATESTTTEDVWFYFQFALPLMSLVLSVSMLWRKWQYKSQASRYRKLHHERKHHSAVSINSTLKKTRMASGRKVSVAAKEKRVPKGPGPVLIQDVMGRSEPQLFNRGARTNRSAGDHSVINSVKRYKGYIATSELTHPKRSSTPSSFEQPGSGDEPLVLKSRLKWFSSSVLLEQTSRCVEELMAWLDLVPGPLSPDHMRITWKSTTGQRYTSDIKELKPGGIMRLFGNLERHRGIKIISMGNTATTAGTSFWTILTDTVIGWANMRNSKHNQGSILPQTTNVTQGTQTQQRSSNVQPGDILMMCMQNGKSRKSILQKDLSQENIDNDQDLGVFLRKMYTTHRRGALRSFLSLRTVRELKLVRFRLPLNNRPLISSCPTNSCRSLPPRHKALPLGKEYRCTFAGVDEDTCPPIPAGTLKDFFQNPRDEDKAQIWLLGLMPKRICGELQGAPNEPTEGWGIWFEEGWNIEKILLVLVILFFGGSSLFGIIWAVLKKDIQGGYGVASYWITASTILVAYVAIRVD